MEELNIGTIINNMDQKIKEMETRLKTSLAAVLNRYIRLKDINDCICSVNNIFIFYPINNNNILWNFVPFLIRYMQLEEYLRRIVVTRRKVCDLPLGSSGIMKCVDG